MSQVEIDTTELRTFLNKVREAGDGGFKREVATFLEGVGIEFLNIVEDEIRRLKVIDTGLLLHSFQRGGRDGVWVLNEGDLSLEVGTNVKYADYVNSGHAKNPAGVERRFVPGTWSGGKFRYTPGAKEGMVLKQGFVPGKHYFDHAVAAMERVFPGLVERKLQEWLDSYFGGA